MRIKETELLGKDGEWNTFSYFHSLLEVFVFYLRSCYVVQAGFEFVFFLPQPPKCWDYRLIPLFQA
jgi:hypothetical protein